MRVLLIGGTGFIGYHAVHELWGRGHEVVVLARAAPKAEVLPPDVGVVLGDVTRLGETDLATLLQGCDAAVFAAGSDDRTVPRSPAYDHFHTSNVLPVHRLAAAGRKAGIVRMVVVGSYFTHFARQWPQLRLEQRHPYIRSRVAQREVAVAVAGDDVDVVVLEVPYVFGSAPGRTPLWAPLVRYVTSRAPLLSTSGGANMMAVEHVAEAVSGAVERGSGGRTDRLIGDENVSWRDFLTRLAAAGGVRRRVFTVPTPLVAAALHGVGAYHRLRGKESGLRPAALADLQTAETFFDPAESRRHLGYGRGGLDDAFERTVAASLLA